VRTAVEEELVSGVGALLATGVGPQRRSRGGWTKKVPAPTDTSCRPVAFMLTAGPLHGYRVCSTGSLPPKCKGYGSNAIRRNIESKKAYDPRSTDPCLAEFIPCFPG
jgi:hypothetical protein